VLPIFQSMVKELMLLQTRWSSLINPVLDNPIVKGRIVREVALGVTSVEVNHRLGRTPQGWLIIDSNANETVWRTSPLNQTTLELTASGPVTVSLYIF
jgi:hypothetical protein